jgi:aminobenzoyl-glutamate utilization protein B
MLMGNGIEFMREHVPSTTRIHYIITKGGVAPNVVPDLSQLFLMARNPSGQTLAGIWDRILKVSQGAALMTGTTVDIKIINADSNLIPNTPLAADAQKNLEEVGGWTMNADQKEFALKLQKNLGTETVPSLDLTSIIQPLAPPDAGAPAGSTDVGDISWNVPTIGFMTATFVPGVAAHTWQAAASTGMSIGQDGMVIASKALALTAVDLFTTPQLVQAAKADFGKQIAGKTYLSAIPAGQKPPLDYREN